MFSFSGDFWWVFFWLSEKRQKCFKKQTSVGHGMNTNSCTHVGDRRALSGIVGTLDH